MCSWSCGWSRISPASIRIPACPCPPLPGVILVALLAVAALYEILRSFRMDKTRGRLLPAICPAGKRGSFPGGRMLSSDCRRRVDCYLRRRRNCRCSRHRDGGDGGCLRRRGLIPGPGHACRRNRIRHSPAAGHCSLAYSWCWRTISRRLTTRCWPGTICRCWASAMVAYAFLPAGRVSPVGRAAPAASPR